MPSREDRRTEELRPTKDKRVGKSCDLSQRETIDYDSLSFLRFLQDVKISGHRVLSIADLPPLAAAVLKVEKDSPLEPSLPGTFD